VIDPLTSTVSTVIVKLFVGSEPPRSLPEIVIVSSAAKLIPPSCIVTVYVVASFSTSIPAFKPLPDVVYANPV